MLVEPKRRGRALEINVRSFLIRYCDIFDGNQIAAACGAGRWEFGFAMRTAAISRGVERVVPSKQGRSKRRFQDAAAVFRVAKQTDHSEKRRRDVSWDWKEVLMRNVGRFVVGGGGGVGGWFRLVMCCWGAGGRLCAGGSWARGWGRGGSPGPAPAQGRGRSGTGVPRRSGVIGPHRGQPARPRAAPGPWPRIDA